MVCLDTSHAPPHEDFSKRARPSLVGGGFRTEGVIWGEGRPSMACEAPLAYCINCQPEGANAVQRCGRTLLICVPADAFLYFAGDKVGVCQRGWMVAQPARRRVARFRRPFRLIPFVCVGQGESAYQPELSHANRRSISTQATDRGFGGRLAFGGFDMVPRAEDVRALA
jgi:hypothetical protein